MSDRTKENTPKSKEPYISPAMRSQNTDQTRAANRTASNQTRRAPRPLTPAEEELIQKAANRAAAQERTQKTDATPSNTTVKHHAAPKAQTKQSATPSKNTASKQTAPPKRDFRVVESSASRSENGKNKTAAKQTVKQSAQPTDIRLHEGGKKQPASRPKKKIKQNYTLYYIAFGLLAAIMLCILSLTVLFPVSSIQVVSANEAITLQEEQILLYAQQSGIEMGQNLLRTNQAAAEKRVLDCDTAIDAVKVRKKLPGSIIIEVNPSEIAYVYYNESDHSYYAISQNGRVVESGRQRSIADGHLLVCGFTVEECELGVFYDEKTVLQNRLARAEKACKNASSDKADALEEERLAAESEIRRFELFEQLYDKLSEYELANITAVDMKRSSEISFTYDARIVVELGGYTDVDYKLALAKEIITAKLEENAKGTLNLSVPSLPGFREDT